jgi:hypothetical protein
MACSVQTLFKFKKTFHQQWKEQYCRTAGFVKLVSQEMVRVVAKNLDIEAAYPLVDRTSMFQSRFSQRGSLMEFLQKTVSRTYPF